jgi:protein-tyrosine-phosphatase
LRAYDPEASDGRDEVPDPWAGLDAEFDEALEMIERSCRGLVNELNGGLAQPAE